MESFLKVFHAFHKFDVEYILVGGVAVILHDIHRFTESVDVYVKRIPANIEKLQNALKSIFNDKSIDEITYDELERYSVIRYGTPDEFYIDIIDRIGDINYNDLEYETVNNGGTPIRLATIETLIKLKQGTLRQIDKADVFLLQEKLKENQ